MEAWQEEWYERGIEREMPMVSESEEIRVKILHRLTADENGPSPGFAAIQVIVKDENGEPVQGMKVAFTTKPSEGIAYEHINPHGVTNERGFLEWRHLGIPTRYIMVLEDGLLVVENIRTDLGNEYRGGGVRRGSWRPTCTPGRYSFRGEFEVQRS